MTKPELIKIFIHGVGIIAENEDGIMFGETAPYLAPDGVDAVMQQHTKEVDYLLEKIPNESVQSLELFCTRGFTMLEYQALFDANIKEKNFALHPAIRSLWIETDTQKQKVIYNLQKHNFKDYFRLLSLCLANYNPQLLTFFFRTIPTC